MQAHVIDLVHWPLSLQCFASELSLKHQWNHVFKHIAVYQSLCTKLTQILIPALKADKMLSGSNGNSLSTTQDTKWNSYTNKWNQTRFWLQRKQPPPALVITSLTHERATTAKHSSNHDRISRINHDRILPFLKIVSALCLVITSKLQFRVM